MNLLDLPPEVLSVIFSHLKGIDLAIISQTCRALKELAYSEVLWQQTCRKEYGVGVDSADGWGCTYKELYGKVLHKYGSLLGVWRSTTDWYGGFTHVQHEDKGSILALEYIPQKDIDKELVGKPLFSIVLDSEGNVKTEWLRNVHGNQPCSIILDSVKSSDTFTVKWTGTKEMLRATAIDMELTEFIKECDIQGTDHMLVQTKFQTIYENQFSQIFLRLPIPRSVHKDVPIQPGLFKGTYGGHGTEIILLTYDTENQRAYGLKVTGDSNVPAGERSIDVDLSKPMHLNQEQQQSIASLNQIEPDDGPPSKGKPKKGDGKKESKSSKQPITKESKSSRQPFIIPNGVLRENDCPDFCIARYHSKGTVSPQFYRHPSKVKTHFVVFDENKFAVVWLTLHSISLFSRVTENFQT